MIESIEVGDTRRGELDVVFSQSFPVELGDVGREQVEGVDARELRLDDSFGLEWGRKGCRVSICSCDEVVWLTLGRRGVHDEMIILRLPVPYELGRCVLRVLERQLEAAFCTSVASQ